MREEEDAPLHAETHTQTDAHTRSQSPTSYMNESRTPHMNERRGGRTAACKDTYTDRRTHTLSYTHTHIHTHTPNRRAPQVAQHVHFMRTCT